MYLVKYGMWQIVVDVYEGKYQTFKLKTALCYTRVMNSGGIRISSKNNKECKNCFYNGIPKKCC